MKSSFVKLNHVSTLSGKGQSVFVNIEKKDKVELTLPFFVLGLMIRMSSCPGRQRDVWGDTQESHSVVVVFFFDLIPTQLSGMIAIIYPIKIVVIAMMIRCIRRSLIQKRTITENPPNSIPQPNALM
jgi:hypothetical protein